MPRRICTWTLPRTAIELGKRTAVMGILNVTPDSFSDGGAFLDLESAIARAQAMEAEGADILDIGGESSRPGSQPVSEEEEIRRVLPVVEALSGKLRIPVSVDTYRSGVARRALAAGAQVINDISAFRFDPEMPGVVREFQAGAVLMHSRGTRETLHRQPAMGDPVGEVRRDLKISLERASKAGIADSAMLIDPGIGFGKSGEESLLVLSHLEVLSTLQCALLVGTSRKSFIARIVERNNGNPADKRLWGTAATVASAVMQGAHVVRVHDVAPMRTLTNVVDAIIQSADRT